jgi:glycosyltransferase involved in cell wall biosynthesis
VIPLRWHVGSKTGAHLRVVYLNYVYDRELAAPEDLLGRYVTVSGYAEALSAQGADVMVLQRFHGDAQIERNGVTYVFHADRFGPRLRRWQIPVGLHRAAARADPALVHANGLVFPLQLRALRAALPHTTALVAQDHAGAPSRRLRALQAWCLRPIDAFLFTTWEQAAPWSVHPVYEILEGSTLFRWQDRAGARARTGMTGSPIVLWVGRLIALKDPLAVVRGFLEVLRDAPDARLYMVYSDDSLARDIPQHPAVTLVGAKRHADMQDIYNSADYFVLGSHSESGGYALIEAMACGVVPVVSDIPSFRRIVGQSGALWTPGDATAFASAFTRAMQRPLAEASPATAADFDRRLSFTAIARDSLRVYREVVARRNRIVALDRPQ